MCMYDVNVNHSYSYEWSHACMGIYRYICVLSVLLCAWCMYVCIHAHYVCSLKLNLTKTRWMLFWHQGLSSERLVSVDSGLDIELTFIWSGPAVVYVCTLLNNEPWVSNTFARSPGLILTNCFSRCKSHASHSSDGALICFSQHLSWVGWTVSTFNCQSSKDYGTNEWTRWVKNNTFGFRTLHLALLPSLMSAFDMVASWPESVHPT